MARGRGKKAWASDKKKVKTLTCWYCNHTFFSALKFADKPYCMICGLDRKPVMQQRQAGLFETPFETIKEQWRTCHDTQNPA